MSVASYYDTFHERLIEDYRIGNRRVVEALSFARESLSDSRSILDVGCGIGWSSSEMAATGAEVTGLDISPALIDTARSMFEHLDFELADFLEWEPRPYDAVLMIDVYEHFPRESRARVHGQIARTGARKVVLTVPTQASMQYARDNGIALQLVDEDVTEADVGLLAEDVGGRLTVNRLVSIWRTDDYRHVLVEA